MSNFSLCSRGSIISLQKCRYKLNNSSVAIYMDSLIVITFRHMIFFRHKSDGNSFAALQTYSFPSTKRPKSQSYEGQNRGRQHRAPWYLSLRRDFGLQAFVLMYSSVREEELEVAQKRRKKRKSGFYSFILLKACIYCMRPCISPKMSVRWPCPQRASSLMDMPSKIS